MFSKALPCLSAIGGALSPDYSYTITVKEQSFNKKEGEEEVVVEEPDIDIHLRIKAPFAPVVIDTLSYVLFNLLCTDSKV